MSLETYIRSSRNLYGTNCKKYHLKQKKLSESFKRILVNGEDHKQQILQIKNIHLFGSPAENKKNTEIVIKSVSSSYLAFLYYKQRSIHFKRRVD